MVSSASAARTTDKLIGEVLANRYLVEERLGEGAMGAVYKARHVKVGRAFAVKVLHPELLADGKVAQRFEREAELAGRLRHPNVIGVVDVGETGDGFRYMVMDFAEGESLAELLAEAPMPAPRIIHLTRQLLEGLYHAHEAGLIHRDFKPENVIIERDMHGAEVPRIVDFGIAILREGGDSPRAEGRLTTNGLVLGTPHYMAPEQAVADPIDHRIDLFALGIVLYEMLSGKLPFDGSGADVARANLLRDPPPIAQRVPYLEVDPLLEGFARRLMAKKRDHRPATAKAARELLDLIERDRPAAAAELGVALTPSTRLPTATEPVSPRTLANAVTESVSPQSSESNDPLPAPESVAAPTDPTEPLGFAGETSARRRRIWMFAGAGLLAAGGLVAGLLARDGEASGAASQPPGTQSSAAPEPVDPDTGSPSADTVAAMVPDTGQPDTAQPDTAQPDTAQPDTAQPDTGQPDTGQPDTAVAIVPDTRRPDTTSAKKPDRRRPRTKPEQIEPAATPGARDATSVARKYQEIGGKLKAMSGADDLWSRYRLIRISDAMRDPAKLAQTADALRQLEREIAARKKSR